MDSYAAVKLSPWGDVDGKVRLVINQCDDPQIAKAIASRFEATCRRFLGIHAPPASTLATRPDLLTTVIQGQEQASDREFRQSIRLLAADVMSASLAIVGQTSRSCSRSPVADAPSPTKYLSRKILTKLKIDSNNDTEHVDKN